MPLHLKVAAGLTTGAIGISIASPTDLVKVRLQAEGKLPAGAVKKYPSAMAAYRIIVKQEGFAVRGASSTSLSCTISFVRLGLENEIKRKTEGRTDGWMRADG